MARPGGSRPGRGLLPGGGLWLSPDLDTRSRALRRWGPLGWIWWPYRRLLPHRSPISHAPLLGTAGRLLLLIVWCGAAAALLEGLGLAPGLMARLAGWAARLGDERRVWLLCALLSLELSAWLHLLLDGDPDWPRRQR
ncbi:DUF2227 family putative metal-binding protein [Synechococcus sp. RSCCF101]|uniref:DUF2227 family putative metal-binding protein n=1 Tax=Synechococcus sp. RSCCF101 TaxID=2511069 RepID=UPI00351A3002